MESSYFVGKSFDQITNSIIQQLTKAVVNEKHRYDPSMVSYKLGGGEDKVRDIVKVEGTVNGASFTFRKDSDYRLANNSLEWLSSGTRPDKFTSFEVSYVFGDASGITDVNPGSVVRTVVESVSREIQYLYSQLDYVYRSGFIDTAKGKSLDLVVALLGVTRKPSQKARGTVIFGRKNPPPDVAFNDQVVLYDGAQRYPLRHAPVKSIESVKGIVGRKEYTFRSGADYTLRDDSLEWLASGTKPDNLSEMRISYKAYRMISVPAGTSVSTFSRKPADAKIFDTVDERVLARTESGSWEGEVPVEAQVAGPEANVLSGSITIMPKPIEGVEYVINRNSITGGSEPEGDEELRERSRSVLRSLGRATYASLKEQIELVDGVVRPIKIEEMPILYSAVSDGEVKPLRVPGVVRVIVDGGDEKEIRRVIDETRAAGVYVELVRPTLILLDVRATLYVASKKDEGMITLSSSLEATARERLQAYVGSLLTGQTIIFARFISALLGIEGVSDVADLTVEVYKEGKLIRTVTRENIALEENQKAQVRNVTLTIGGGQ